MFETASFHIVKPCNMKCKFCYATFDDMHVKMLPPLDAIKIIKKLKAAGLQKLTFAGGEPMLYPHINDMIGYAKGIGLVTSIITNGSKLDYFWLNKMRPMLDWIGISIDSRDELTNDLIGRMSKYGSPDYNFLIKHIKKLKYKLKINTVVNLFNWEEDMNEFISWANPDRWKVFQALRVEGQNDKQFNDIKVSDVEYAAFINRHKSQPSLVAEDNEAMTGSYLLIDPQGRLFENSAGKHTYSDSLVDNSVEHCLNQINLNREMFEKRGGIYQW